MTLLRCTKLLTLELSGNPLLSIPAPLRTAPWPVLRDYLSDIESTGKMSWFKSKVMVLGKEGAGKTHILRRLQSIRYERNESTNGVDINEFRVGARR
jgi:hypothetical protein